MEGFRKYIPLAAQAGPLWGSMAVECGRFGRARGSVKGHFRERKEGAPKMEAVTQGAGLQSRVWQEVGWRAEGLRACRASYGARRELGQGRKADARKGRGAVDMLRPSRLGGARGVGPRRVKCAAPPINARSHSSTHAVSWKV